jgi:hypothetical protein
MPLDARRIAAALGRAVVALAAGIACGAVLVSAYIYLSQDDALVFEGLLLVSVYYGLAIAAICVPVWLMLARFGWDRAPAAAALGFVATAIFLVLTDAAGGHVRLHLMAYTFVPYALCGAVAALVTWGVGRKLGRA